MVWALPRSLAATWEIDLSFSSSGYLDVSVPRVPPSRTMCSSWRDGPTVRRVSTFGYLRVFACLRLSVAFRSLPRPSSALGAWASALCSSSLDYILRPCLSSSISMLDRVPLGTLQLAFLTSLTNPCLLILELVFLELVLVNLSFLPLCSCQGAPSRIRDDGGSQWTRTTDLSLIRRVL